MPDLVCDFCSGPDVQWRYRCPDFSHGIAAISESRSAIVVQSARGDWAACPACHALIETGDRDRLARRSARRLSEKHGMTMPIALFSVTQAHADFFAHRADAPPIRVERTRP